MDGRVIVPGIGGDINCRSGSAAPAKRDRKPGRKPPAG